MNSDWVPEFTLAHFADQLGSSRRNTLPHWEDISEHNLTKLLAIQLPCAKVFRSTALSLCDAA